MGKKGRPQRPRRSKGMLIRMRDAPNRAPRRERPLALRIVQWILGSAAIVVILGGIVLLGIRFLFPSLGAEIRETTVRVEEIVPAEESPTRTDVPVVRLEGGRRLLGIAPEESGAVEEGAWVRVTYEWLPNTGTVRVQSWSRTEAPPADEGSSPGS